MEKNTTYADRLTGALIGLSMALEGKEYTESASRTIQSGLALLSLSCSVPDQEHLRSMTDRVHEEKALAAPDCATCLSPCGRTADYDMNRLWNEKEPLRSRKILLLHTLCQTASLGSQTAKTGLPETETSVFLLNGLFLLGYAYEPQQLDEFFDRAGEIWTSLWRK